MNRNFSITKFLLITLLVFFLLDILIGKFIYKKFIRIQLPDTGPSHIAYDEIFDHKLLKNLKQTAGWGNIRYTVCTDSNGFINSCKNQFDNLKKFDIGFIGDSFTEGVGLNYEETFVGIISSELKNLKIANLAVSSYSPSIYYSKINFLLSRGYNFKEIIVFVDISDLFDDTTCYKLKNNIIQRRETVSLCNLEVNPKNNFELFLRKRLRLSVEFFYLIKHKLYQYGFLSYEPPVKIIKNTRSGWTHNYKAENYNNLKYNEATSILKKNMGNLAKLLKNNNIDLSIAVYPWPETLKFDSEKNKHVKLWKDFCNENCKNFYNFMPIFFSLLEKEKFSNLYQRIYFKDDVHFNKEGNKIIAKQFLHFYKQN